MLLLLVSHTMYRNLHKYFIDLLTSYMIQYSSGYDPRFPRKQLWFEFQLGDNLLFIYFLLFSVCFCCFHKLICFSVLSLVAPTIRQLLHLVIKSQKAVDILYCVQKFSLFMRSHSSCLHKQAFFDPTNEVFMQQKLYGL